MRAYLVKRGDAKGAKYSAKQAVSGSRSVS